MSKKEATIIILDVGANTNEASGKDGTSFFQRAKSCVSKIIQKKIFAKPNDEVGLVLMGSDDTSNDLNTSLQGFDNIVEFIPVQMSTWEMVRKIEKLEIGSVSSDWIDALVVGLNFARNETQAKKFSNIRIILITNFQAPVDDSNLEIILNTINESTYEFLAVSDCIEHTDHMKSSHFSQTAGKSSTQSSSQQLFSQVIEQANGVLCHIERAEAQLLVFQKKQTRSMPWNVELTIGSKLKIGVSAYKHVEEEKMIASFKTECAEENTATRMVTEYMQNNERINKPDEVDVIKAYMYGNKMVSLDVDKVYTDTDKCLACLGFTKRELVLNEYLAGEGSHVILPQKGREKSEKLFASLVQVMEQGNMVMVARKIYRDGINPIIVALLPEYRNDIPTLTMVQLAFANGVTNFSFPKLRTKKTEPTLEQQEAIQELVNAMDLMDALDDDSGLTEAFAFETTLNPVNQYLCRSVAHRALHPSDPLPTIDAELVSMIDVPPKVKEASEKVIAQVEELFPLELVERKAKKVFGISSTDVLSVADDAFDDAAGTLDDAKNIVAIGTVTPAEDFGYLLKKGERFGTLAEQMQTVVYDLIFRTASIQLQKILESIMMYREQSKLYGPFNYNNWVKELKTVIVQRNRLDFWETMVKEGFGLITANESAISSVTAEEQQAFYDIASKDTNQSTAMEHEDDEDLDALLG